MSLSPAHPVNASDHWSQSLQGSKELKGTKKGDFRAFLCFPAVQQRDRVSMERERGGAQIHLAD